MGEACLKALEIKESDERGTKIWRLATFNKKDFSNGLMFCSKANDDNEEDGDTAKIKRATKVMGEALKDHFEFNFSKKVECAPVLWGGLAEDGNVVGVLCL